MRAKSSDCSFGHHFHSEIAMHVPPIAQRAMVSTSRKFYRVSLRNLPRVFHRHASHLAVPFTPDSVDSESSPDWVILCSILKRQCLCPGVRHDLRKIKENVMAKYGRSAEKSVRSAMRRRKRGSLKSGKGGKGGTVKSRKQAIAIGLSEARKKGAKVPRKKSS